MKYILFIHDKSMRSRNVLNYVISLATKLNSRLLIGQIEEPHYAGRPKVLAGNNRSTQYNFHEEEQSLIKKFDVSAMNARELAELVNKEGITLVIKCAPESAKPTVLDLDNLLSHIHCPLLLIPGQWLLKDLDRMVYLADLRYCRNDINRYLAHFAAACGSQLSIAHLTKEGMVHIEENYAHRLFDEQIRSPLKYERLGFHYTREMDVVKATDVLVKGLQNDLVVMTRGRYHFNQLVGQSLNKRLPARIQVPLLLFPG